MGNEVSYAALTPLGFLKRSADVWRDRVGVVEGDRSWTYGEHYERVRRTIGMLRTRYAVGPGDRVAVLLPNNHAMLELHYAVPGASAVLVPMNTRLTGDEYAYIVSHSGAVLLIADAELRAPAEEALASLGESAPPVLWVGDGEDSYDALVERSEPLEMTLPDDERALLSINYTSGTTGRPKGVMTVHRGAYLHSLGVVAESGLGPRSAYLWTLPMFHCNGWAYTWAITATGAKHVCLPKLTPAAIWKAIAGEGVTHMCAAPTVVTMMLEAPEAAPCERPVAMFVGGSPPSPTLLERAAQLNVSVTHLYGLTETYGPIGVCAWNPDWDDMPLAEQARLRSRQGVTTIVSQPMRVVDADMNDVPRDAQTMGEVLVRGNNVMLGYYRDPDATAEAFRGGWFHTGDLGVMCADGYVELRDRLKDVIISGGENISTIEVEQAILAYPSVAEAAVVGAADERWGEVPVAFITLRGSDGIDQDDLREFLRGRLARFKVPKRVEVVPEFQKTGTGKIQKFVLRDSLRRAD